MSTLTAVKPYDEVFDGQRHYRTLLQSTARPGTIGLLDDVVLEIPPFLNRASALTTLALFSDDVTFYVSNSNEDAAAFLRRETGAKAVPASEADFLILGNGNQFRELGDVRLGTLIYPETSVTAIVQVDAISPAPIPGSLHLTLTGPGIETETVVFVLGLPEGFLERRSELNCEFPVGVDCFLTCDSLSAGPCILGLPRTTHARWERIQ